MQKHIKKHAKNCKNSDYAISSRWRANFINTAELTAEMKNRFTYLFSEFDPTGTDGAIPLPANKGYAYTNFNLSYRSDQRKNFSYRIEPSIGTFFNGKKYSLTTNLAWRIQPYFSGSMQINYDKVILPNPFPNASIWLIGPKSCIEHKQLPILSVYILVLFY